MTSRFSGHHVENILEPKLLALLVKLFDGGVLRMSASVKASDGWHGCSYRYGRIPLSALIEVTICCLAELSLASQGL